MKKYRCLEKKILYRYRKYSQFQYSFSCNQVKENISQG